MQNLEVRVNAEHRTLGGLMLLAQSDYEDAKPLIQQTFQIITRDHFCFDEHRLIFDAIINLYNAGTPIDPVTLAEYLEKRGHLEPIGGGQYLGQIYTNTASAKLTPDYARLIVQYAQELDNTELELPVTPLLIKTDDKGNKSLLKQNQATQVLQSEIKNLRYDAISEEWMMFKSNYWQRSNHTAAMRLINQTINRNTGEIGYSVGYVNGIALFLKWELMTEQWNEQRDIIPLQNGVLNLGTMELTPHTPDQMLTWQLPYVYSPNATCDPIIDWLKETVKDDAQVELLRAYLNCIVLGRIELQRYLELIGPGGSGKGTFIRLAEALVGGTNTHVTELKRLESGDASRFETARIYGKRLIIITDAEKYASDVSTLKALTGQDPLPYEEKNKQGSRPNFRSQAMVLIAANEVITSSDYTSGLQRRRMTVRFENAVLPEKRRDLEKEFEPCLPGLLNWVLAMPAHRVTELVGETEKHVASLNGTSRDNLIATNPLAAWLDTCTVYDPDTRAKVGRANRDKDRGYGYLHSDDWLYPSYCEYCESTGIKPVSLQRFSNLLIDLTKNQLGFGDTVKKLPRSTEGVMFSGLRIKTALNENSISPVEHRFKGKKVDTLLMKKMKTMKSDLGSKNFYYIL